MTPQVSSLVIGASGLVGGHLLRILNDRGARVEGTYRGHSAPGLSPLNICDAEAVRACIELTQPEVIYLPASLTNVDYCELHPDESFAVNVQGVRNVIASVGGARIVYFSSDYVFAGDAGPYCETDSVHPLNVYGKHKVLAEQALPENALIIRTTVAYGWELEGKNFVYRLQKVLGEGNELRVPVDQLGNPTYAPNLALATVVLAEKGARGIQNVAGPKRVSRYEFALEVARVLGLNSSLIRPVTTSGLHQSALRPLNAGMISDKAQAELPFALLDYHEGLMRLRELLA